MPLDPQAEALLKQMAAEGAPQLHTLAVPEARQLLLELFATKGDREPVGRVEDLKIPGPAGSLGLRIYTPRGSGPFPVLVYFHGGGWTIGDLETHDAPCRALTNGAGCVVTSVDYRLAPQHKFPAAVQDCDAATRWVAQNAATINADATRLAVGGDSAGANLAAVVALLARDRGTPSVIHQLLVYPVTDHAFDTASYRENADGYLLTRDAMHWFWNHYLTNAADGADWRASPLRVRDVRRVPPARIITAEFDPLRDEGEAYAARLRAAGVPVQHSRYDGMIHGFFSLGALMDQGKRAIDEAAASLREAFAERRR
jgi:acetyl esterase